MLTKKDFIDMNNMSDFEKFKEQLPNKEDGKALWKFMNNAVYHKKMENLRNRIDVRLISNKKNNLKWISKPSYMLRKIFDKNLVAIHKNEVTLTLNKATMLGCVFWIWAKYWCMSSIIYTLKINMIKAQDYYSHWYW